MAERRSIYHNPNLEADADAAGVDWRYIGEENVGVGYDVQELHDGFMASPGHRQNIMFGEYNVVGMGVVAGDDGRTYVAQVYATVARAAPTAPVEAPEVAPAVASEPEPELPPGVTRSASAPAPATVDAGHEVASTPIEPEAPAPIAVQDGVVNMKPVFTASS